VQEVKKGVESNISYLRKIPVFSHLTDEELKMVDEITKVRKYRKNMLIFVEGEHGDELYFVKKGRVKISKLLEDGSEKILHILKERDIFAEVLLFGGGEYPATAEVIEDAEIGIIENKPLEELLKKNGEMTLKILKVMAERLRRAQYHIRDLALRDACGRLSSVLLDLVEEHGEETPDGVKISVKLSQQQLANMVGTSRETAARILGMWRKEGIIKVNNQIIEIVDMERLKEWL